MPTPITTNVFVQLSVDKYGTNFDYTKTRYRSEKDKIIVKCKICGFEQFLLPEEHLEKGCLDCGCLRTENLIKNYMNSICEYDFSKQLPKILEELELKIYCPHLKIGVMYTGSQHYKYNKYFHPNVLNFQAQQENDRRLLELCTRRGIDLIFVPPEMSFLNEDKLLQFLKMEYEKIIMSRF